MHSDHPTMGDLAYQEARYAASRSKLLYERVTVLEDKIEELVEAINHLAVHCGCNSVEDLEVNNEQQD